MTFLDNLAFYSASLLPIKEQRRFNLNYSTPVLTAGYIKGLFHNGMYDNTDFVKVECFKFAFLSCDSEGTREHQS